jgi:hypothetical protein
MKCVLCERENPKSSDSLTEGSWLCKRCGKKSVNDDTVQVLDKDHVIVNELLTYVCFYYLNSSIGGIKDVLKEFYHPKEVSDAKVLLWQIEKDNLPAFVIRQDSDLRSAKEADIADIVNAFKKMDNDNVAFPEFVCRNMDRIPKYGPEEIDLTSVVDRLAAVESKMSRINKIDSRLNNVECSSVKNKDSIDTLFSFYYQSHSMSSRLQSLSVGGTAEQQSQTKQSTQRAPEKPAQVKLKSKGIPDIFLQGTGQGQGSKTGIPERPDIQLNPNPDDAARGNSADRDGFRYSKQEIRKKRKEAVYGKRSSNQGNHGTLRGAPQTLDIFVFRCDKNATCDKVRKYMEDNSTSVLDIECVSSVEARYRSYRVSVPRDSHDDVMDGDFWPEGVGVRYFKRRRAQFVDTDSQNGCT